MPAANDRRRIQKQGNPLARRRPAPRLKRAERRGHRFFGVFGSRLLVDADNLCRARRIEGANLSLRPQASSANDQVILAAKLACHVIERGLHLADVFRVLEVDKRLIGKAALRCARLNVGGKGCGYHNKSSVVGKAVD